MDKSTLIHKVLSDDANEIEKAELYAWISSDPDHAEEFEDMKLLYDGASTIEERLVERDEKYYDGLRNIRDRIKALKQKNRKAKYYRMAGIVTLVSTIMLASIYFFDLYRYSRLVIQPTYEIPGGAVRGIMLSDILTFDDATLESIVDILEDKYHLIFKIHSRELLSCRFTGTFLPGITIDEMIRTLAQSEDFNYTAVDSKTYELHGKGCPL